MRAPPGPMLGCVLLGSLLATGCATIKEYWSDEDNTTPPAPLVEFEPLVEVQTLWTRSVGASSAEEYLKLTPAVEAGRVFAAGREGEVRSYDAASGQELWETDVDVPVSGGPGTGSGLAVVGSSDGDVVALSEEDGKVLWKTRVSSEVLSAPQAAEGVVVVRTIDGRVFGLSAADGSRLWVYDRSVPVLTLRGTSTPTLVGDTVIAGFDSGNLVALSIRNAQLLWETRIAIPSGRTELERMVDIDAQPVVQDGTVYVVAFQGRVAALDLASGNVLWRRDMSSHSGLAVDHGNIYVTDDQSHVWALDRFTSASVWQQSELEGRRVTAPAVLGDYVAVGDLEGYVHWMRRSDGRFAARVRVDKDGIISAPVVADGILYVYGEGGELAALRVKQ